MSLNFDKPVYIIRIIDSKKEKFELGKLYRERFPVHNYITNPEIEILMIIQRGDYSHYKVKNIKSNGVMRAFFNNNIDELISSIIEHKKNKGKSHYTLADLLK